MLVFLKHISLVAIVLWTKKKGICNIYMKRIYKRCIRRFNWYRNLTLAILLKQIVDPKYQNIDCTDFYSKVNRRVCTSFELFADVMFLCSSLDCIKYILTNLFNFFAQVISWVKDWNIQYKCYKTKFILASKNTLNNFSYVH